MNTPNNAAALERLEAIIAEMHGTAFAWNGSAGYDDVMYRYAVALEKELATLRATLAQPDALTSSVDMEAAAKAVYDAMPYDGRSETGSKPAWVPGGNSIRQGEARSFARAAISALTGLRGVGEAEAKRGAMVQMLMAASEDIDEMAKRTGASRFPSVEQLRGWRRMVDSILAAVQTLPFTPSALTSQPSGEAVAWTVVGPDGKSSIGGWHDISTYEVAKKMAVLRDGHRYAFATHPSADAPGVAVDGWRPIETAPKEAPYWVVWSAYYQRPVVVTQRSNDNTYWEGDWDFDVQATHWTAALAPKPEGGHG